MTSRKNWGAVAALSCLAGIGNSAADADLSKAEADTAEAGTAICVPSVEDNTSCEIAWDFSTNPRTYYRIERLDAARGSWITADPAVFVEPYGAGIAVDVQQLYRVLGCNDSRFRRDCAFSTAVWAVAILPLDQIPDTVDIRAGKRETSKAQISKALDAYGQNSQYNVYRMTDLLNRAAKAELPAMLPPAEPARHGDLEHQIQHNVQSAYEALRAERRKRPGRKQPRGEGLAN